MPTTPPFRLPSLKAFTNLSVTQRYAIFKRWLARQPKGQPYSWYNTGGCVLAQFGNAIYRQDQGCHAGDVYFYDGLYGDSEIKVLPPSCRTSRTNSPFRISTTFGELAARLKARR